jgi:L-amino acid N-acyltransferase YncA
MTIAVSAMTASDWMSVSKIYQEGIDTGNATFESQPPVSWEEWCKGKLNECSIVARDNDEVVGWAALTPFSKRAVYAGVAQVSIYVSSQVRGKGVGSILLQELIRISEGKGIWTLQARIFPENQSSRQLHLKHGFREVGILEKLGKMQFGKLEGQWRNVVLLERRSKSIGI